LPIYQWFGIGQVQILAKIIMQNILPKSGKYGKAAG